MSPEHILAIGVILFAFFSFSIVLAVSVIRERESLAVSPSGLARRAANFDLEGVAEPKHKTETWFNFVWVRFWRAVATYIRCKRRTMPGRMDLLVVTLLMGAFAVSWLDIIDKVLDVYRAHLVGQLPE